MLIFIENNFFFVFLISTENIYQLRYVHMQYETVLNPIKKNALIM